MRNLFRIHFKRFLFRWEAIAVSLINIFLGIFSAIFIPEMYTDAFSGSEYFYPALYLTSLSVTMSSVIMMESNSLNNGTIRNQLIAGYTKLQVYLSKYITDFIYRSAVSGQLVSYNDSLINEYNDNIEKNKNKQIELKQEMETLTVKQKDLETELSKLGQEMADLDSISVDIDAEIKAQEKVIDYYEKTLECKLDDNINNCGKVPYSGKFVRPIQNGRITSPFGSRCYWNQTQGRNVCTYHYGIDIAGGDTQVYAAAPGTVANILWYQSCGGNMLFVNHNVGGVYYTTGYYHLKSINVKIGDYVDQNTVIAITGGDSSTWGYDKCSTGRHLHFAVATGLYMKDYISWSTYQSRNINPITVVNFPAYGIWFSNRVTKY